jgi:hypothetical protein
MANIHWCRFLSQLTVIFIQWNVNAGMQHVSGILLQQDKIKGDQNCHSKNWKEHYITYTAILIYLLQY